jgi:hypothetical protein
MFPINQEQGEISLAALTEKENKNKFGKSFLFDFEKGDFILIDGKPQVIEGEQALKVWINKTLRTEKIKYKIYEIIDNEYGVTLIDYLSSNLPTGFIYAGIQRSVSDALLKHSEINAVTGYEFERIAKGVKVSFTALTTYGEITEGVSI